MRNNFILLVATILVTISHAQTALEQEFLNQLNIYRKQHKLGPTKYDAEVSRVSAYHTKYMVECERTGHSVQSDKLPHDEQFDIKGHREMTFVQRVGMAPDKNIWGEISIPSFGRQKGMSLVETARAMVIVFDGSPGHKQAMLFPDAPQKITDIVGISIVTISTSQLYEEYSVNIDFGFIEK